MAEIRAGLLEKAVELATNVGHVFIATSNSRKKDTDYGCNPLASRRGTQCIQA